MRIHGAVAAGSRANRDSHRRGACSLGLSDVADVHPGDLPLPRRRLAALAALLVSGPELLLLDEPTAGLDAASRQRVIELVRRRVAERQTTLVVTHDPIFAHEALDRGLVLTDGAVRDVGAVRHVLDDVHLAAPAALVVARALGMPPGHDRRAAVAASIIAQSGR